MKSLLTLFTVSLGLLATAFGADTKPADAKGKVKGYPLDTCIVTENNLDSMGGEITRVYDGQEVKFCCRACIKKFEKNQERYLSRMEKESAAEAAGKSKAAPGKP